MHILWFNWRDIKNPDAGGAEVFTHEVMRRLAAKGYSATLFTSEYAGCSENETIDGINIIRSGNKYQVYKRAIEYYRKHQSDYDLVIDEINTRPFLTPRFVRSEEHTSELQSRENLVCRLLLEKKKKHQN